MLLICIDPKQAYFFKEHVWRVGVLFVRLTCVYMTCECSVSSPHKVSKQRHKQLKGSVVTLIIYLHMCCVNVVLVGICFPTLLNSCE